MVIYTKLFSEFRDFVKTCANDIKDEYERKLINLILQHFDDIAESGTAAGKRAHLLNRLIQEYGKSVSGTLSEFEEQQKETAFPFRMLRSVEVEQFRGFSRKESIHFDKQMTFIYGPNGSGKSSLCEALEFSLLGYINEAITRRIDVDKYIRNSCTGKGIPPEVSTEDSTGKLVTIAPDPSLYHFCFIEKNRIEAFGRISGNTPSDKKNLLAVLFGLAEFNDFVGNFTKNTDNYIDTVGKKQEKLKEELNQLKVRREIIDNGTKRLGQLEAEKKTLVDASGFAVTFDELELTICGSDTQEGQLEHLKQQLTREPPAVIKADRVIDVEELIAPMRAGVDTALDMHARFESRRDEVRFSELYQAAIDLEEYSKLRCPVCETPIDKAFKHPFENARAKLKGLSDIARLENDIKIKKKELKQRLIELGRILETRKTACEMLGLQYTGPLVAYEDIPADLTDVAALVNRLETQWCDTSGFQAEVDAHILKNNQRVVEHQERRRKLNDEHKRLQELSRSITELKTKFDDTLKTIADQKAAIDEFTSQNDDLIKESEAEKAIIEENKRFVAAYRSLLNRLNRYKEELPIQNIKNLNSLTLEIYQMINAADTRYERASKIELPSSVNDLIKISFEDEPDHYHDALHILSEGHIRCLGLSILLAKSIQLNCPVIIFDDVVNAIDDDHRGGVKNVIFNLPSLAEKQIILTTHGSKFVKELEQQPNRDDYDRLICKLAFFADPKDRLIRIKSDSQQNYLFKIDEACIANNWDEVLYNCRCCLESLTHKLWKKLDSKGYKTFFQVVIRTPNGIPDLMSAVSSMNKFLKKHEKDGDFTGVIAGLDYLLGIESKNTLIWSYLNEGTHEREGGEEYDQVIVKEIAAQMHVLDKLVKP